MKNTQKHKNYKKMRWSPAGPATRKKGFTWITSEEIYSERNIFWNILDSGLHNSERPILEEVGSSAFTSPILPDTNATQ